jgi:hypothetical protein
MGGEGTMEDLEAGGIFIGLEDEAAPEADPEAVSEEAPEE